MGKCQINNAECLKLQLPKERRMKLKLKGQEALTKISFIYVLIKQHYHDVCQWYSRGRTIIPNDLFNADCVLQFFEVINVCEPAVWFYYKISNQSSHILHKILTF